MQHTIAVVNRKARRNEVVGQAFVFDRRIGSWGLGSGPCWAVLGKSCAPSATSDERSTRLRTRRTRKTRSESRRVPQSTTWAAAAFCWAFFSQRGKRCLCFFWSFGGFVEIVCGGAGAGSVIPASDASLPAAVPIAFAVVVKTLSSVAGPVTFLRSLRSLGSLGFCSSAIIPSQ